MDEIEIQIFDEITNYKEKFGWFTIRQWIFIVLIAITVIPTYIFVPKVLGDDITSYIILIEAAGIGFIGFVPVHNLPAEKIIPFWFRHYFIFHKPLEYMTMQEYKEMKEEKKNKRHNKAVKEEKTTATNKITEPVKAIEPIVEPKQETTLKTEKKPIEASTEPLLEKKTKKQKLTKEEKALMKAKKKYGYLFKDDTKNEGEVTNQGKKEKETTPIQDENMPNANTIIEPVVEKEYQEIVKNSPNISVDENGAINPFAINSENEALDQNSSQEKQVDTVEETPKTDGISKSDELNKRFNSLSDEEKEVFLKLVGK